MATESRARFNKVYVPGLFLMATESYKRYGEDFKQFINVKKTEKAYEEIAYMSGLGKLATKPEGTGIAYDARVQGPSKKWVVVTKALGVRITEEAIDDDLYNVMQGAMKELGVSAAETINCDAYDGFNSTTKTSADGNVIFYGSHKKLDGTTYSNLFEASSVSLDALMDDIASYEAFTDHNGKYINRVGGVRTIVANPANEWKLAEIFNSVMNPETANNAINALKKVRSSLNYFCTPYITSTTARFYVGEMDDAKSLTLFTRKPVTFAREGDFETGDAKFKVTTRYTPVEVADPMNIAKNAGA